VDKKRIQALADTLHGASYQACLFEDPIDLYYFTGLSLSAGSLLIAPHAAALFVDGRYFEMAKAHSSIAVFGKENEHLRRFFQDKTIDLIAIDSSKISVESFEQKKKEFPLMQWEAVPYLARSLRAVKDQAELKKLRHSAQITKQGFLFACQQLKEGITEQELAWAFERFCREHGASRMAFDPIVAFGEHSAFPHHHSSDRRFQMGDVVLIDIGCVVDSYASDMTRTLISPHTSQEMQRIGKIVKQAQRAARQRCKPGIKVKELDEAVREIFRREDLEDYFTHSLGHGIGLETHEFPRLTSKGVDGDTLLKEGMVVTIEPGLYLPGIGGARHEDTVIVTQEGIENLYGDLE
jgi:Xaa-Pro aminopeptidase